MGLTAVGFGRAQAVCSLLTCPYAVLRHGDRHYHCEFYGEADRVELNDEFRNGPESNCPAGRWAGVKALDVPTITKEARDAEIAKKATRTIALLKAFGATIPVKSAEIENGLTALVADGHLDPEIAAKVEEDLLKEQGVAGA